MLSFSTMGPVRMTIPTMRVLKALLDEPTKAHYGLEMAKAAKLPGGTIYPILARLETAGWVTGEWEDIDPATEGRRPRRYYRLTRLGTLSAQEELEELLPNRANKGSVVPSRPREVPT